MTASDTSQNKKLVYEVYEFEEIIGKYVAFLFVKRSHLNHHKERAIMMQQF
jgi:hypothetical protein